MWDTGCKWRWSSWIGKVDIIYSHVKLFDFLLCLHDHVSKMLCCPINITSLILFWGQGTLVYSCVDSSTFNCCWCRAKKIVKLGPQSTISFTFVPQNIFPLITEFDSQLPPSPIAEPSHQTPIHISISNCHLSASNPPLLHIPQLCYNKVVLALHSQKVHLINRWLNGRMEQCKHCIT